MQMSTALDSTPRCDSLSPRILGYTTGPQRLRDGHAGATVIGDNFVRLLPLFPLLFLVLFFLLPFPLRYSSFFTKILLFTHHHLSFLFSYLPFFSLFLRRLLNLLFMSMYFFRGYTFFSSVPIPPVLLILSVCFPFILIISHIFCPLVSFIFHRLFSLPWTNNWHLMMETLFVSLFSFNLEMFQYLIKICRHNMHIRVIKSDPRSLSQFLLSNSMIMSIWGAVRLICLHYLFITPVYF